MARTEMVKHDTKLKDAERKIQILRESLRILEQKQNDDLVNQYFTQSDTGTAPTASTTGSTSSSSNRSPTCHCCWSGPCPRSCGHHQPAHHLCYPPRQLPHHQNHDLSSPNQSVQLASLKATIEGLTNRFSVLEKHLLSCKQQHNSGPPTNIAADDEITEVNEIVADPSNASETDTIVPMMSLCQWRLI